MADLPKILICTRFSFFGRSGWKSEFSADPEMLFEQGRLEQRFWLFENITLPSLVSQTDKDFHYFILSSRLMPDWAKQRLRTLCDTHLGRGNFTIKYPRGGLARKHLRVMLSELTGEAPVAQVVLDDDDGLSCDFVARLKTQLSTLTSVQHPHFVTFPNGYALGLRENSTGMWKHSYRFINLGLTMIGSTDQKNVFGIDHIRAPERLGFTNDSSMPMFVRTLSNVNDSRVTVGQRWVDVPEWAITDDIKSRFAFLLTPEFQEYHKLSVTQSVGVKTYSDVETD